MRKLVLLFMVLVTVCCSSGNEVRNRPEAKHERNPEKELRNLFPGELNSGIEEAIDSGWSYQQYMIKLIEKQKDWPFPGANGEFVPSRDPLEESDTIVDGYGYNRI